MIKVMANYRYGLRGVHGVPGLQATPPWALAHTMRWPKDLLKIKRSCCIGDENLISDLSLFANKLTEIMPAGKKMEGRQPTALEIFCR